MKNPGISIVIPTLNEQENIMPSVRRIDHTLSSNSITYEIIFIDDHSTDKTRNYISTLKNNYPIQLYRKTGKPGKAFSLLEGFAQTKYPITAMIDADLQYPPELIPAMYRKIMRGKYDVIVANRKQPEKHARWIVMQQNDAVWKAVFSPPEMQAHLYKYFERTYTSPEILIFRRKEEYEPNTTEVAKN